MVLLHNNSDVYMVYCEYSALLGKWVGAFWRDDIGFTLFQVICIFLYVTYVTEGIVVV